MPYAANLEAAALPQVRGRARATLLYAGPGMKVAGCRTALHAPVLASAAKR